jgi:nucleoside-diphosphate kinase
VERTLVIVKPDGMQRGLVGEIISRLERRGLRLVGMKLMQISKELASRHYSVHKERPFYDRLVEYITSSPTVVMVWEANDAIDVVRTTMGVTNPSQAAPGTIRGDFGLEIGRNLIHGSDGPDTAAFEIDLFFDDDELVQWERDTDRWIFE